MNRVFRSLYLPFRLLRTRKLILIQFQKPRRDPTTSMPRPEAFSSSERSICIPYLRLPSKADVQLTSIVQLFSSDPTFCQRYGYHIFDGGEIYGNFNKSEFASLVRHQTIFSIQLSIVDYPSISDNMISNRADNASNKAASWLWNKISAFLFCEDLFQL